MREDSIEQPAPATLIDPLWSKFEIFVSTMFGTLSEKGFEGAKSVEDESLQSVEDATREEAIANVPQLLKAYRRLSVLVRFLAGENVPCNQLALHHLINQTGLNIERIHKTKPHRVAVFAADMFRFPVLVSNPPDNVALDEQLCRVEVGSFVSKQDLQSRRKQDVSAEVAWYFLNDYKVEHGEIGEISRDAWPALRKKIGTTIQLKGYQHCDWYKQIAKTISIRGKNPTPGRVESKMKAKILDRIHAMLGLGTNEVA